MFHEEAETADADYVKLAWTAKWRDIGLDLGFSEQQNHMIVFYSLKFFV